MPSLDTCSKSSTCYKNCWRQPQRLELRSSRAPFLCDRELPRTPPNFSLRRNPALLIAMLRKRTFYGDAMRIPKPPITNTCLPFPPPPPLSLRLSLNSAMGIEHGADDAFGRQRCLSPTSLHHKLNPSPLPFYTTQTKPYTN